MQYLRLFQFSIEQLKYGEVKKFAALLTKISGVSGPSICGSSSNEAFGMPDCNKTLHGQILKISRDGFAYPFPWPIVLQDHES